MFYKTAYLSPLGKIELVCDEGALVHLSLLGQRSFTGPVREEDHPILGRTKQWLDRYFAGQAPDPLELPLGPAGTPFRQVVWQLLLKIPYGQTTTYGALAKQAVGANPISIVIPCHRVVGADGSMTGYAGGVHYKIALLKLEAPEP